MLSEKLHIILTRFLEKFQGHHDMQFNFDDIRDRLSSFVLLNEELSSLESDYEFNDLEEEIQYYREVKPNFQKYGIYYERIYNIELEKPYGDIKYYARLLKSMKTDYNCLRAEIIYYRSKKTDKDELLFRKESKENHIFALIKALEMIEKYLLKADSIKSVDEIIAEYPDIYWSENLASFMEFMNGLKLTNVINDGDMSLEEITMHFAKFLKVDVKNVHGTTHDVMMRQEPARFTKTMVKKIEKKQEELLDKDLQRKLKK